MSQDGCEPYIDNTFILIWVPILYIHIQKNTYTHIQINTINYVHTLNLIGAMVEIYACLLLEYCPKAGGKPSSAVCAIEVEKADMNELDEKHGHEGQPVSWAEVYMKFSRSTK